MIKFFLYISISLLVFNSSFAKNIDIQEDIKIGFVCELEKKILKNSEYNYKTFLAKDLDNQNLDKFEIDAKKPEKLLIDGLSVFLSKNTKFDHCLERRFFVNVISQLLLIHMSSIMLTNFSFILWENT